MKDPYGLSQLSVAYLTAATIRTMCAAVRVIPAQVLEPVMRNMRENKRITVPEIME